MEKFTGTHIETREKSVHIEHNGIKAYIPRSQIHAMHIDGDRVTMSIPQWLYDKKFESGESTE